MELWRENVPFDELTKRLWEEKKSIIRENNGFHTMPEYQSLPLPGSKIRELQKKLEELKKYKSDDGKIWCRFINIMIKPIEIFMNLLTQT